MMWARSTRFAGSVRDREISTGASRWSVSTDNAIMRRTATMAPPCHALAFHTLSRRLNMRTQPIDNLESFYWYEQPI
jgi:hypothetical protein